MPNRMLRDWTNSDKINNLSVHAEVFFTRLIMKVDDHGCFWADVKRLKGNLFILKSDSVRDADISRWMAECQKAGLIVVYKSDGKEYLQISDFNQRLRTKTSKFPLPSIDGHMTDTCLTYDGLKRREVEEEIEVEEKKKGFAPPSQEDVCNYFLEKLDDFTAQAEASKFVNFYESKNWFVGKNKMKNWNAAAAGWLNRMNDFKPKNNGTHQQAFSGQKPGTADDQNASADRW